MILNLLGCRGIGKVELVRIIGYLLDQLFERNIFLVGRAVGDAQAVIKEGSDLSPGRRTQETLTGRQPAPAEGAKERHERQRTNPSHAR